MLRRATFAGAAKDEQELEMHEGLAEYSGTALAEPSLAARVPHVVKALHDSESTPAFVRSFAYASGPAYGALLDAVDPHWTRKVKRTDDFGALITHRDHITASKPVHANTYPPVPP